jgi:hypothetical protein
MLAGAMPINRMTVAGEWARNTRRLNAQCSPMSTCSVMAPLR